VRELLPRDGAVVGIDLTLAEDKQALAVIDHDVRVLARKTVRLCAERGLPLVCIQPSGPAPLMRGFTQNRQIGTVLRLAVMNRIRRQIGGYTRLAPTGAGHGW
jgi:hypothetical protein